MKALIIAGLLSALTVSAAEKKKKEPPPSALDQTLEQLAKIAGSRRATGRGQRIAVVARRAIRGSGVRHPFPAGRRYRHHSGERKGVRGQLRQCQDRAQFQRAERHLRGRRNHARHWTAGESRQGRDQHVARRPGTTTRDTTLTTTLSAFVMGVLPNGNLIVQGVKNVGVNSENQTISVRGVIRPIDLDTTNTVASDRVAQMEIKVNGKGIVNDSVKRPFILYRLLLDCCRFRNGGRGRPPSKDYEEIWIVRILLRTLLQLATLLFMLMVPAPARAQRA